ncbi:MAG TPA: hydroxyacid dehydrogenase [Tepidisphaeraceae bacterium]|nr:hydroxyacid dehydrogenase [Tepidisphaeraceae bacterium]
MDRVGGLYILDADALPLIYGPDERRDIDRRVRQVAVPQTAKSIAEHPERLRDVEVLFSGWGAPVADEAFLEAAPRLRAIFYGAGSVAGWITDAVWQRGVVVSSAYAANAVPVAEYALSVILFSLKHGWSLVCQTRQQRVFPDRNGAPGCYGSTVGLVSLGVTARTLLRLLRPFDLKVIAYDPYVGQSEAEALGVDIVSLDELFARSDVVSCHTPLLEETVGMITGEHLASMKRGATFVNTARGQLVREREMTEVLSRRADLCAVLDVAAVEPPEQASPLYELPNVVLTPHIAGSVGNECRRMGRYMVEELERFLGGQPLRWAVTPEMTAVSSHRPLRRRAGKVTIGPAAAAAAAAARKADGAAILP